MKLEILLLLINISKWPHYFQQYAYLSKDLPPAYHPLNADPKTKSCNFASTKFKTQIVGPN
jgi:hypothetical protein